MPVIDNLEIFLFFRLLRAFDDGEELNSYTIVREYYSNVLKDYRGNLNRFLSSKNMFVLSRVKKLNKEGLIEIKRNGKKIYFILNNDKVIIKKRRLRNGLKNSISIMNLENKETIYEI